MSYNANQAGGYHYREGYASSNPKSLSRKSKMDFLASKWPKAFMATVTIQAIICLAFEIYVFVQFQSNVLANGDNPRILSQYKSIPTFLTLFIFAFVYELILVWDALRMKNTIQVIGLCVANLAVLVYTAIQIDQIGGAIEILREYGALKVIQGVGYVDLWAMVKPLLVAIPCIIGFTSLVMFFIAWKLYQVFAWDILKQIGADYRMKQRFLHYQIFIALLKFDFFFFLGFTVQFLVIVDKKTDVEFGLTIAAIPITIAILLLAAFFARREVKVGMGFIILLCFGALSWFLFKLVRIYQPETRDNYEAVKRSLTAFAVLTIILIILTITNAFMCMNNFGKGLKAHTMSKDNDVEKHPDANSIGLSDVKPSQLPSRMTID